MSKKWEEWPRRQLSGCMNPLCCSVLLGCSSLLFNPGSHFSLEWAWGHSLQTALDTGNSSFWLIKAGMAWPHPRKWWQTHLFSLEKEKQREKQQQTLKISFPSFLFLMVVFTLHLSQRRDVSTQNTYSLIWIFLHTHTWKTEHSKVKLDLYMNLSPPSMIPQIFCTLNQT